MRHKDDGPKEKKPYEPPALTIYGTVRELTKKVGNTGSADGSFNPTLRTGLP
jgi:hypothetical protein